MTAKTPINYICETCGSPDLSLEGFIRWDTYTQQLVVADLCDKGHYCGSCDGQTRIKKIKFHGETEA